MKNDKFGDTPSVSPPTQEALCKFCGKPVAVIGVWGERTWVHIDPTRGWPEWTNDCKLRCEPGLSGTLPSQPAQLGTWPKDCLQRAFVDGASWWQFHKNGSTMFPSERDEAEAKAIATFGQIGDAALPAEEGPSPTHLRDVLHKAVADQTLPAGFDADLDAILDRLARRSWEEGRDAAAKWVDEQILCDCGFAEDYRKYKYNTESGHAQNCQRYILDDLKKLVTYPGVSSAPPKENKQ